MKSPLILTFFLLTNHLLNAKTSETPNERNIKQKLNNNMTLKYLENTKEVNNFSNMLTDGIFYGRYRINSFIYDAGSIGENHQTAGMGGSLIYKSAKVNGFSYTSGFYFSQSIGDANLDNHRYGKDTFSSNALKNDSRKYMRTFAQNYLSFQNQFIELRLGDFLMESFLLQSHDTKMIPNAFEGLSLEIHPNTKTAIKLAYITKQKLRDHEKFHSVLSYSKYDGNDDGAMHRGLTKEILESNNVKDKLLLAEIKDKRFDNMTFKFGYTAVPQLISSATIEGKYRVKLNNNVEIKPAIKYMQQFDEGAGNIAGANLRNNTLGYQNKNSLNISLITSKIDLVAEHLNIRLGYSNVANKGDIVAPWHGLPTGGYSRAMSTTNWYANTETFLFKADYTFSKKSLFKGFKLISCYAVNDFDDYKPAVSADTNVMTLDLIKHFDNNPNLELKLRSIIVSEDHKVHNVDNSYKKDPSYKALRLEMNYLF